MKYFRDEYKNHPLLTYRRQAEKQKEIQQIIKKQAVRSIFFSCFSKSIFVFIFTVLKIRMAVSLAMAIMAVIKLYQCQKF